MSTDHGSDELLGEYDALFNLRRAGYARLISEMEQLLPVLPTKASEADLKACSRLIRVLMGAILFLCVDAKATNDLLESSLKSSILTKENSKAIRNMVENLATQLETAGARLDEREVRQKSQARGSQYM